MRARDCVARTVLTQLKFTARGKSFGKSSLIKLINNCQVKRKENQNKKNTHKKHERVKNYAYALNAQPFIRLI